MDLPSNIRPCGDKRSSLFQLYVVDVQKSFIALVPARRVVMNSGTSFNKMKISFWAFKIFVRSSYDRAYRREGLIEEAC
jgi:hypothetical protein